MSGYSKYTDNLRAIAQRAQSIRDGQAITDAADRIDAMESVLFKIGQHLGVRAGDVDGLIGAIVTRADKGQTE